MTTQQQIAATILNQLGGYGKLNAMLGLKDVFTNGNGVSFKIKFSGAAANYVNIQLNNKDLYDVEIGKIKGMNYVVKEKYEDVFAENLKKIIENTCKVYLSI